MSVSTSEAVGDKNSVFLANAIRLTLEILLSIIFIYKETYSITVAKSDIYRFVVVALFHYAAITLFYISATLLPVGNIDGSFIGLYIAFTTCLDIVRKQVSKVSIIFSIVAIIGLILLTQPWNFSNSLPFSPCEYIDNNYSMMAIANDSHRENISIITRPTKSPLNPLLLGYTSVVLCSLCICLADNIVRSLYTNYSIFCVFLWTGLFQAVFTGIIFTGLAIVLPSSLSLPSGPACLSFSIVFIFLSPHSDKHSISIFTSVQSSYNWCLGNNWIVCHPEDIAQYV